MAELELTAHIKVESNLVAPMGREVGLSGTLVGETVGLGSSVPRRIKLVLDESKFEVTR
jgi:hypothetical protein